MKKLSPFLLLVLLACGKDTPQSRVLTNLVVKPSEIDADGSSSVTISVMMDRRASADRRDVVFTASGGTLAGGADGKLTVKADYVDGQLVAKAILKAPMSPGTVMVTAAPVTTVPGGSYLLKDSVKALQVLPKYIALQSTSMGIGSNYTFPDTITVSFSSEKNKKVSTGAKVDFEAWLAGGRPAGGRFVMLNESSDGNSQVKAAYGAPLLPLGTDIFLVAVLLDSNGGRTGTRDTVIVTVNQ